MKDVTSRYRGAFFVLLSAFLYGFIPILAVFAYKKDVSVMSFHLVRFTIASVALFCLLYLRRGKTAISVSIKGVLLAGLGALSYTSYILYGNFIIKDVPYQVVVAHVCFFSAISFLILGSVARGLALPNASSTWILLCFVAFVSLFGFLSFFLGVELTSPSIAAILSMAEPLVTVVLSLLIFKEYLSITQYFGGVLVLVGSFLVLKASASR